LRSKQTKILKPFADRTKILEADVRKIKLTGQKGIILTNELPDAFPMHLIKKLSHGSLTMGYCIPVMKKKDKFCLNFSEQSLVEKDDSFFQSFYRVKTEGYFLSKQTYLNLKKIFEFV